MKTMKSLIAILLCFIGIQVSAQINVAQASPPIQGCSGFSLSLTYNDDVYPYDNVDWSGSTGQVMSTSGIKNQNASIKFTSDGTITVSLYYLGNFQHTYNYSVIMKVVGTANAGASMVCPSGTTSLSCSSCIGDMTWSSRPAGSGTYVNFGTSNGNGSMTSPAITQAMDFKVSSGCHADNSVVTVGVYSAPTAGAISGTTSICSGSSPGTFPNVTLPTGGNLSYQWQGYIVALGSWANLLGATGLTYAPGVLTTSSPSATFDYRRRTSGCNGPDVYSNTVTVTVYSSPTVGTLTASAPSVCNSQSVDLNITAYNGSALNWQSRYSDNSGLSYTGWTTIYNQVGGSSNSGTLTTSGAGNRIYQFQLVVSNGPCATVTSNSVNVTVYANSGGTLSPATFESIGIGSPALTLTGHSGTVVRWESNTGHGWVSLGIVGSSSYTFPNVSETTSYRVIVQNSSCSEVASSVAVVTIDQVPITGIQFLPYGTDASTTLSTVGGFSSYQWIRNDVDISGATGTSYMANLPGDYKVRVTKPGLTTYTTPAYKVQTLVNVDKMYQTGSTFPVQNINITSTTRIRKQGVKTSTDLFTLLPAELNQTATYADGLGRTYQQIAIGQSPAMHDLVQVAAYNANGLSDKNYLLYATDSKLGYNRYNALLDGTGGYTDSEQKNFYEGTAGVAVDNYPYAATVFANSMMGRAREQGAPGSAWQPGGGHTVKSDLILNVASEVRIWKPDLTTNSTYSANTLAVSQVTDENGNKVKTYTDKAGKTILKKVQLDATIGGSTVAWLETYYVYDVYGRIMAQIPPKAISVLGTGSSLDANAASVSELIFKYTYDERSRLTQKKVPGAAVQYLVYDTRDRLILIQDGNLRTSNKWAYVKYDIKQRPVITGVIVDNTHTSLSSMQNYVTTSAFSTGTLYESRGTTLQGYTNTSYPVVVEADILTVNYFDDYDFDNNTIADYSYTTTGLSGEGTQASAFGRSTGNKRKIMGTSNYLIRCSFYDTYGRVIQSQFNNHLRSTVDNLSTVVYNFANQPVMALTSFNNDGVNWINTNTRPTYDHAGRLTKIYQSINAGPEQLVVKYNYNELGQMIEKKLHLANDNDAGLQSVDYRYNIRGWLQSINNATLTSDGILNDDTNDYFGMELAYEAVDGSLGNTGYFNGNISAIKWKSVGAATGTNDQRSYKYNYDKSDKLTQGRFQMYGTSAWDQEVKTLSERMQYDHNGNITSMTRRQNQRGMTGLTVTSTAQMMDSLAYTYTTGNQLSKVEDGAISAGFVNGMLNGTNEYTYDANGNLTSDQNKGIGSITYNDLGKVQQVNYSDGRVQTYLYAATGEKLTSKTYSNTGVLQMRTDFVAGLQYENGELKYQPLPEGRVARTGKSVLSIAQEDCSSTTGFTLVNSAISSVIQNGETYLKVVAAVAASPGVQVGTGIPLVAGKRYVVRVKGYVQSGAAYSPTIYLYTNLGAAILWSSSGPKLPVGATNEDWINYEFTPATGVTSGTFKMLFWETLTATTEFYLNKMEIKPAADEYQYSIQDHQGNTRVLFSSVTGTPQESFADMESTTNVAFPNYGDIYRSSTAMYNKTAGGTTSELLNGGYSGQIGLAKSYKVYPGDKLKIEAYGKYYDPHNGSSNVTGFATALLSAFGATTPLVGEVGTVSSGLNQYGAVVAGGNGPNEGGTKAFVNILLFDKDHKFLNVAYDGIDPSAEEDGVGPPVPHNLMTSEVTVKEAGYAYLYVSNENAGQVDVYFDDVKITYTPGNVIQSNEYYPFGMRTADSWDRVDEVATPSMATGLALKIDFDGNNANDKSGHNLNGTINGGAATSTLQGRSEALVLDGVEANNQYVQIADNSLLDFGNSDFAIALWLKKPVANTGSDNREVISKWGGGAANDWTLMTTINGTDSRPRFAYVVNGTTYNLDSPDNLTIGMWNHLAIIRQGALIKLYVNGVLKASATIGVGVSINNGGANIWMGKWAGGLNSNVAYDDLYIYNRSLSEEELRYLYLDKPELMVNKYLYNGGSEYNSTAKWYETMFRGYDAALGRMNGVDMMASKYGSVTPYNYAFNNPVMFNDPSGADPWYSESTLSLWGGTNQGGYFTNKVQDYGTAGGPDRGGVESFFSAGWTPGSGSLSASTFKAQDDRIFFGQAYNALMNTVANQTSFALGQNGVFNGYTILTNGFGNILSIVRDSKVVQSKSGAWISVGSTTFTSIALGQSFSNSNPVTNDGDCTSCNGFHWFAGAELSITRGWANFAAEVKNVVGLEMRLNAEELVKFSSNTAYAGSLAKGRITKVGAYILPLYGAGSTYSKNRTVDEMGREIVTESFNFGAGVLGVQINLDDQGVKDVRFGLDGAVSLAAFFGIDLGIQLGGIYINH